MSESLTTDRYISFSNIDCDSRADLLIEKLKECLNEMESSEQWYQYFHQKFTEQDQCKHDNLYYIGSQLNTLFSFFEEIDDQEATDMLYKLEQECC